LLELSVVVNFTPLDVRGWFGEEKNLTLLPEFETWTFQVVP
jgi:hypothetical protein